MNPARILPELRPGAKILFIRLRSLGDTLLSTPLYAALKAWRSDFQVSVLVEKPNHEILSRNPDIHCLFQLPSADTSGLHLLAARSAMLRRLRAQRFDCCINLHGGSTSSWLTGLCGATHRVGLETFRHSFCYNVRIALPSSAPLKFRQHTVEYQMGWLRSLGMPVGEISPLRLFPDPAAACQVEARLARAGITADSSYCIIQPTSKFYTKEWTSEGFAEIADHMQTRFGYRTLLTGGPGEKQKLKDVFELCRSAPVILDEVSISELIWIIKRAKLFIGNDSGPTHLAAALNVPIVALFGSSDSKVWYPWKVAHSIVQNPFECNPCPGYRCLVYEEPKCILSITAEQVKRAIEQLLRSSHA
jgi:heptosyltransferase-3